ncbi:MAG TPA: hypothetical protein VI547_14725 [Anaerolineales bacterium]|nr:hypothetical protein [Anaerolineales bacterium]
MPRIRCHYEDCIFLEEKYCGAAAVEIDPDDGCQTYSQVDDSEIAEAAELDDDLLEEEEEEELYEEEEEDDWDDEEDEDYR